MHQIFHLFIFSFQFYLERHAPLKKKILRANHKDFIDKTNCKEIMYRSQLKNKFNKNPTHQNKLNYRKQCNKCVKPIETFSQILISDKCRTTNASGKQSNHYSRVNLNLLTRLFSLNMILSSLTMKK